MADAFEASHGDRVNAAHDARAGRTRLKTRLVSRHRSAAMFGPIWQAGFLPSRSAVAARRAPSHPSRLGPARRPQAGRSRSRRRLPCHRGRRRAGRRRRPPPRFRGVCVDRTEPKCAAHDPRLPREPRRLGSSARRPGWRAQGRWPLRDRGRSACRGTPSEPAARRVLRHPRRPPAPDRPSRHSSRHA